MSAPRHLLPRPSGAVGLLLLLAACGPTGVTVSAPTTTRSIAAPATRPPLPPDSSRLSTPASAERLRIVPLDTDEVGRYELLELTLETDILPANPFDPDEFDLRVVFTSPSGAISEIGAFWYRAYSPPGILGSGEPSWKARFTPTELGVWTAIARIPEQGLESEVVRFEVTESDRHGFVRVHPEDPRYLAFDDGTFFYPIGLNMAWWTGAGTMHDDYGRWMTSFAGSGGNTIRVWMAEWSFGLEWDDTDLGDYSRRLGKAWLLDELFRMAEQRDVYIVLVLLNCADFNNWQTNGWNQNPYNASRGGPLERPEDFATDPEARRYLQRRLDYIVRRWGYSPHLLAWEWWNEVNLTPITDEALTPWLEEMTAFVRARDVNRHLTTNSYAIKYLSPTWSLPELDIIQRHEYADQVRTQDHDLAARAAFDLNALRETAPVKPVFLGEFGYGGEDRGGTIETTGIHLHNGLWATTFVGYAGTGMYWFWDIYIEANGLWPHFRSLERFLEGIDLTRYEPFSPLEIRGTGTSAVGLGLRGDDVLVWLRSEAYTVDASEEARRRAGSPAVFVYNPPVVDDLLLTLDDMPAGAYVVNWYNPQTGRWMDPVSATAQGGRLTLPVPPLRRDLAARIVRGE